MYTNYQTFETNDIDLYHRYEKQFSSVVDNAKGTKTESIEDNFKIQYFIRKLSIFETIGTFFQLCYASLKACLYPSIQKDKNDLNMAWKYLANRKWVRCLRSPLNDISPPLDISSKIQSNPAEKILNPKKPVVNLVKNNPKSIYTEDNNAPEGEYKKNLELIALFAYGSIVNNPYSNNYNAGIEVISPFQQADFTLPLSFSRISSQGTAKERITLVPDSNGPETPVYYATVRPNNLSVALKQLKAREGTNNNKFVSYVRKGILQNVNGYKTIEIGNEIWSYRTNGINKANIKQMINHLKSKRYTAGIITTFDQNGSSQEIEQRIGTVPGVKANTISYYNDLPEPVKRVHHASLKKLGVF